MLGSKLFVSCAAISLLPCAPLFAIGVGSGVDLNNGVRAQAVIGDPSGFDHRGSPTLAVAIKEVHCAMLIRDAEYENGIQVSKKMLSAGHAWGFQLPNGYTSPPTTDPEGPWFGLVWPFRDQYDYFPDEFDPLADDVGTFFSSGDGVYGYVDVDAILRGGPTDPEPAGGGLDRLDRGITGNGLNGPATYFNFEIIPLLGDFNRSVELTIFAATAIVVQRNIETGAFSEVLVPIPDFVINIPLPEPSSALASASVVALLTNRRTRRK